MATFYSDNLVPSAYVTALRGYFDSIKGLFPDALFFQVDGSGDTINDATGVLNGTWSTTTPAPVQGTQTGSYAKGVGVRVVWVTNGVTRGRRVRGTTYLVPMAGNQFDNNGTPDSGPIASIQSASNTLFAADSGSMRIWTRPSTPGGTDGASHAITAASVPDKTSWLRSRRT